MIRFINAVLDEGSRSLAFPPCLGLQDRSTSSQPHVSRSGSISVVETLKSKVPILAFDSLEAAAFHEAVADPRVELIVARPHRLLVNVKLDDQRKTVAFNPLLLAKGPHGTVVTAVRYSWERANPHSRKIEAALTRAYRRDHGVELRWRTELQLFVEPRRTNRRRFAACSKSADPELTASVISALKRYDGRMTVGGLNRELGTRLGWRKLLALLVPIHVGGLIELSLDRELTQRTVVQIASPLIGDRRAAPPVHAGTLLSHLEFVQ